MELINSRRTPAIEQNRDVVMLTPRTIEIQKRYGNAEKFINTFSPAVLPAIHERLDKSVELEVPAVVLVVKTYGKRTMLILLNTHITATMYFCHIDTETIDKQTVKELAEAMIGVDEFRTLNMSFALDFFTWLRQGRYKLYDFRPDRFMNALQYYCRDAHKHQDKLHVEQERIERERQQAENASKAVTRAEWERMRGISSDVADPL